MPISINPSAMDMSGTLMFRGNWRSKIFLEAASADFDAGEAVILSGDDVAQSDTAPGANAFSSKLADNVRILGFALEDASGTTGAPVLINLPMDSSAEVLLRVGSTTTGSDQEVQDIAIGDLAPCYRYTSSAATGSKTRTTAGPAAAGSGEDKFVVRQKYGYKLQGGNVSEQVAGDDFALAWFGLIQDDVALNRSVVP